MEPAKYDAMRAARRALDRVIKDIQAVDGFSDFLAVPTFQQITAAAADQPVVYLTSSDLGGLGLALSGGTTRTVALPTLTRDTVRDRVEEYRRGYERFRRGARQDHDGAVTAGWRRQLDDTTRWLWDDVFEPLMPVLRKTPVVSIVAGGPLGLLPLHAAWTADTTRPTGRRYACDHLAISYLPNVRALAAGGQHTDRQPAKGRRIRRLLAVADIDPATTTDGFLPSTVAEAQVAASAFPIKTVLDGEQATPQAVTSRMDSVDVVHFCCHGEALLETPLDSYLQLAAGARLRMADLLRLRLPVRLAFLSACETSMTGTVLPDEVVGLPTALLQAGATGVVASLWAMDGSVSTMVATEFYRLWAGGARPVAVALCAAQRWVRDTTNADKERHWQHALDTRAGWLPAKVGSYLLSQVEFEDPGERGQQDIHAWASLAHTGA